MKKPVRVGVFSTARRANHAIERLLEEGFDKESLSVVCSEEVAGLRSDVEEEEPAGSHTAESAAAGGTVGAVLGGLTAAVGVAATGGAAFVVVGPLLAGAAAGAIGGGFVGAMVTRGFEHEIADYYDQAVQKGKILVAVEDEDADLALAERIFTECGAEPIELPAG